MQTGKRRQSLKWKTNKIKKRKIAIKQIRNFSSLFKKLFGWILHCVEILHRVNIGVKTWYTKEMYIMSDRRNLCTYACGGRYFQKKNTKKRADLLNKMKQSFIQVYNHRKSQKGGMEAEIQLPLKRVPNSSVSSLIFSCMIPGRASGHQRLAPIPTDSQLPDGDWSTSSC